MKFDLIISSVQYHEKSEKKSGLPSLEKDRNKHFERVTQKKKNVLFSRRFLQNKKNYVRFCEKHPNMLRRKLATMNTTKILGHIVSETIFEGETNFVIVSSLF